MNLRDLSKTNIWPFEVGLKKIDTCFHFIRGDNMVEQRSDHKLC